MSSWRLLEVLRKSGPSRSGDLQTRLGVSQASVSRGLAGIERDVLRAGRARATTYAARRPIHGVSVPVEVFELDPGGGHRLAMTLHPVEPCGFYVEGRAPDVESGFHETDPRRPGPDPALDLPWFLCDLKPAGFLGRAWVRDFAELNDPRALDRWTGDEVLRFADHFGYNLPGAFVVGHHVLSGVMDSGGARAIDRSGYPARVARVVEDPAWHSSALGEQPKFAALVAEPGAEARHCIVKFSPPMDLPGGRRWADLLVAEHVAHEVLRGRGFEACASAIVDVDGRRFLEVERFDRHGRAGRSGLISLLPFDRVGVGSELRSWSLVTGQLADDGRLAREEHERAKWLEAFGHLLANTDMHLGNLSLRLRGTRILGLAPVYDMLPMAHAPRHGGELWAGRYHPGAHLSAVPASARDAALEVWTRVAGRDDVSDGFRRICRDQAVLCREVPVRGW